MQQVKQLSAGDYVNWSIRDWNEGLTLGTLGGVGIYFINK